MDLQSAKHHPVLDLSMPLTELEVEIVKTVVERFFRLKESSPRKLLIRRFRSPEALYRLSNSAILKSLTGQIRNRSFSRPRVPSTTLVTKTSFASLAHP